MNFDKYGCLIQNPSDTGKKKSIHVKAYENRLTHLSLDTHFEVYGICFNLLEKKKFGLIPPTSSLQGVLIFYLMLIFFKKKKKIKNKKIHSIYTS